MLKSYYKLTHKKKKKKKRKEKKRKEGEFGNGNRYVGGLLLLGRVSFEKKKKTKRKSKDSLRSLKCLNG